MPARSKTLGPGFMRGTGGAKAGSGYVSSPDAGGPDINTIRLTSRFSAIPETNYHGDYYTFVDESIVRRFCVTIDQSRSLHGFERGSACHTAEKFTKFTL